MRFPIPRCDAFSLERLNVVSDIRQENVQAAERLFWKLVRFRRYGDEHTHLDIKGSWNLSRMGCCCMRHRGHLQAQNRRPSADTLAYLRIDSRPLSEPKSR
jgi:hypothetical protein